MRTLIVLAASLLTPAAAIADPGHVAAPGTVHQLTQHVGGPAQFLGLALLSVVVVGLALRAVRQRRR